MKLISILFLLCCSGISYAQQASALLNAFDLKKEFHSTLIGEETAGNLNHYGEIRSFTLPGCGAEVTYSTKYFENQPDAEGGLIPDIRISYSVHNFLQGKDEAIEAVASHTN